MKKIIKFFVPVFVFIMLLIPVMSFGATNPPDSGIVPCTDDCDFDAFLELINNVINFILFDMAIPIAAIMFLFGGFELVTSGGSSEKRGKAKSVITNAVIGLALAAVAFILIKTLLSILGYEGAWIGF